MRRALVLLAAGALIVPSAAHAQPAEPPQPLITAVVTALDITHGGWGTLVIQPQVGAGAVDTRYSVLVPRSDSTGTPTATGYWSVPAITVDAAHDTTCTGSDPGGALVVVCRPTRGTSFPVGRYATSIPVRRIGGLTVHHGTVSAGSDGVGFGDTFRVIDASSEPTSTATVREVRVDPTTGNADIAVNVHVSPGEVVSELSVQLAGDAAWFHNLTHPGRLHGLDCTIPATGVDDPHRTLVCVEPDGSPLPEGTMSLVYPAFSDVPPMTTYDTGFAILHGPRFDAANRVSEIFVIG